MDIRTNPHHIPQKKSASREGLFCSDTGTETHGSLTKILSVGSPEHILTAFLLHAEHIYIDVRKLNFVNGILRKVISQRFTQAIETGSEFR